MSATAFVLTTLAAYRIARFVITDDWPPVEWLRRKALSRLDGAWAEGLVCYWCSGTIIAAALVAGLAQVTSIPLPAIVGAAVATGVGVVAEVVERLGRSS